MKPNVSTRSLYVQQTKVAIYGIAINNWQLRLNLTGRNGIVAVMVKSTTFLTYSKKLIKNSAKLIFPEKLSEKLFYSNYRNIFGKEREDFCGRISQGKPVTK